MQRRGLAPRSLKLLAGHGADFGSIVAPRLILRGIANEFRNHVASPQWEAFWDTVFSGASMLLAIFFGAALGNVVRGVPLDATYLDSRGRPRNIVEHGEPIRELV